MPRTQNLRTNDLHVEIREKFLKEDESHSVVKEIDKKLAGNHVGNQRRVELWVQNMLSQKSGPRQALNALYNGGSAHEFLKFLASVEVHAADARDFNTLRDEKIDCLERLDNQNERYYSGNLRTQKGDITSRLWTVILTAEGKMQLFLNGNGALEIALRNEVGKRWIEKLVRMEHEEKKLRDEYNEELKENRRLSSDQYQMQLEHLISQGHDEKSARGMLRGSKRHMYGPIVLSAP
jgi:hypothetical protein